MILEKMAISSKMMEKAKISILKPDSEVFSPGNGKKRQRNNAAL